MPVETKFTRRNECCPSCAANGQHGGTDTGHNMVNTVRIRSINIKINSSLNANNRRMISHGRDPNCDVEKYYNRVNPSNLSCEIQTAVTPCSIETPRLSHISPRFSGAALSISACGVFCVYLECAVCGVGSKTHTK